MSREYAKIPLSAKELTQTLAKAESHIADTNNPHNVTPEQIGTYTSAQIDALLASGGGGYMGEVDVLPENAKKGQIYKLSADYTSGHYAVPTTDVSGIYTNNPSEGYSNIQADGAVKALLEYVYEGVNRGSYGDFPNHHYYYNGQRYSIPAVTSYGRDGIIIYADARFESLLLSGEPIVCDLTRVDAMPIVLANCFVGIKGTKGMCLVWDGAEWKSLDADYASDIADKSVTTNKIADSAVTSAKIANYAVTADKLSSTAVTSSKINGIIAVGKGGTGRSKWDAYKMIYPSSTTAFAQLDLPTAESVLCQNTSGSPYWKFLSEIGGSGGGGGYKKIGYTDDCDYKVSASSGGKAAFDAAISAASDGDTILVLAGDYGGSGTLTFKKNLTFVGIGNPVISFPITVANDSVFNFETDEWTYLDNEYTTNWSGFTFERGVESIVRLYTDTKYVVNTLNASNCIFQDTLQLHGKLYGCTLCKGVEALGYSGFADGGVGGLYLYDCDMLSENISGEGNTYIYGGTYRFKNSENTIASGFNLAYWQGAELYTYGCTFSGEYGYNNGGINKCISGCTIYSDSNPFDASHCENCVLVTVTPIS